MNIKKNAILHFHKVQIMKTIKYNIMKKATVFVTLLLFVSLFCNIATAQQTPHKVVLAEMEYLLYLPEAYEVDTTARWPFMVFLHGVGETGTDLNKLKTQGPTKLIEQGKKFPFIVASPQSQGGGWNPFYVSTLIDKIAKDYRVDTDRVYLTGLSMGGFGTWYTALYFPEKFAAIVPICGGGVPQMAHALKNVPVWCFHGDQDLVVPISQSQNMIDSLKPYNDNVKFTVYAGVGHDSWTQTYDNDDIYDWMLSHKRFTYTQQSLSTTTAHQYAGIYVSDSDTITIKEEGQELMLTGLIKDTLNVKPASDTLFFIQPDLYDHLVFDIPDGNISGFTLFNKQTKKKFTKM